MSGKGNQTVTSKASYRDEEEEITHEDAWVVISAHFREKGLISQQINSFNDFVQNNMQKIVDESGDIDIQPESQHNPGHQSDSPETIYKISFGQLYLGKPMMTESDGNVGTLYPNVARLRKITYSAPLHVKVTERVIKKGCESTKVTKFFIGKKSEEDLAELKECPYDQGGYFIINGSERVLIAQERMSTNHVFVFKKRQPNKYSYVGEVRSMAENQNMPSNTMFVRMLSCASSKRVREN